MPQIWGYNGGNFGDTRGRAGTDSATGSAADSATGSATGSATDSASQDQYRGRVRLANMRAPITRATPPICGGIRRFETKTFRISQLI